MNEADRYEGIVEIAEAGSWRRANPYLEAGYRLLGVTGRSTDAKRKSDGAPWIRRDVVYVLGRTKDVPHFELPAWEPRQADESQAEPAEQAETSTSLTN